MKPLNYDNSPCSPTSSNCVIWQGPDLHCIKLCTGDTVSDVIASLATELCTVMDQLSITNYDLSCFDLVGCKPETYQELLQFLIEQICLSQGLSTTDTTAKSDDVLITVAPCFIVNGVTVMTLIDYVTAIGLRICSIIDQIAIINNTLNELDIRVTILENTPPPTFTLPTVTSDCILQNSPQIGGLGSPAVPIDQLLSILINDNNYGYCALLDATALPASLIDAVLSQCILNTDIQLSSTTGATYSASANWNSNWQTTENNLAASLSNVWVVLCDIYNYLNNQSGVTITETLCQNGIPNNANVYGYIDVTSGPYSGQGATALQNKQILCSSLLAWFTSYQLANPSYTGGLYIFEYGTPEDYLNVPHKIKSGDAFTWLNINTGQISGAVLPPGYASGWACPDAMLFVAFVNEANPVYHNLTLPPTLGGQPSSDWTNDFNTFLSDYTSFWTSFNAVIYPAYDASSSSQNFLLQAYAATNNVNVSLTGLSGALGTNYLNGQFSTINSIYLAPNANPYITANQGLWNYGWGSILNKAVDGTGLLTFTEAEFENDLNSLLAEAGDCNSESLIESWDPISQSLVLRQITSCCLDLSVTSEGCLSIECAPGSLSVVEAGTNINITSNIVGTTTTYTVNNTFPNIFFSAAKVPSSLTNTIPSTSTGRICDGQIQIFATTPDVTNNEFGPTDYDPITGIFTIPADGVYTLSFYVNYSNGSGWNSGMWTAGIVSPTGCDVYCSNSYTPDGIMPSAMINCSITRSMVLNTRICLKVINLSGTNYTSNGSDRVTFSIQRIR